MATDPSQQRLEKLIQVNRLISSTLHTGELLSTIATTICQLFNTEGCSILTIEQETGDLIFHTIEGGGSSDELKETRLKADQGIVGWVVSNRKSAYVNDTSADSRFYSGVDKRVGFHTRSVLCAPMEFRGQVLGAIEAINSRDNSGFEEEDLRFLEAVASQAAVALRNAMVFEGVTREKDAYRQELDTPFRTIIGSSKSLKKVIDLAKKVAQSKATVLIRGESGTGKEVFARAIHNWSPRAEKPLMVVNTVALTTELLESELFGHEKGAFTGAVAQKKGKFEIAEGGTVFLDEIGDIAPDIQTKLLRVLQEHEFQRVGGNQNIKSDIRIIAATNRDLEKAVAENKFREDLYYRLNVVTLELPPLRQRIEDIPALTAYLVQKACQSLGLPLLGVDPEAIHTMMDYHWPGNIRQLSNVIERAVILASSDTLGPEDFEIETARVPQGDEGESLENLPLSEALDHFKAKMIRRALTVEKGNQTKAAKRLGLRQPNLSRMMRTLGIELGDRPVKV
jgi:Nif-specific regulatory protein